MNFCFCTPCNVSVDKEEHDPPTSENAQDVTILEHMNVLGMVDFDS